MDIPLSESLHSERFGSGRPLVLVHGLGSSWLNWTPVLTALAAEREVIAIDLPGHGRSPALAGEVTVDTVTDAVQAFLSENDLTTADLVGSSLGARIVLELARRGIGRHVVALDPGGFWTSAERFAFAVSIGASVRLVRAIQRWLPALTRSRVGRLALFFQFSAHPTRLDPALLLAELRSFALSPGLDPTFRALTHGPNQVGAWVTPGRVSIGWGHHDRVTVRAQAARARDKFHGSRLHWFERSGHYPHWDQPQAAATFILESTGDAAPMP
ncbi:alpha/beta fold hydrolase [Glaciihabitans sp. dw_435]|uniref:alpha/beta fold hydrolase n=1 Tax=Glaciihabitans sp. dw_435 TaxID=2720081 RepID=UPI001BD22901|nr:alpha/beta fold hydrolase [Glaciihabitans sp. dw_435]